MDIEDIRTCCLARKGVTESFPFGDDTLVFKVLDKIFALVNLEGEKSINLKCNPEKALELREHFPAVQPGYHMNKQHWNTVYMDGSISDKLICEWINHSYQLVLDKLSGSKKKN
jgi:predicted DNA-binding protein (MmcQ/YjbR family)